MPDLFSLSLDCLDKVRVGMPKRIDGNARAEIEKAATVGGRQPGAFASGKGKIGARRIGKQESRHGITPEMAEKPHRNGSKSETRVDRRAGKRIGSA
jgi:hypothetical protein